MKTSVFKREQMLPISIGRAWDFFSNPGNLSRITPAALDFRIISELPPKIFEGLEIEYRVRPLLGIPVRWISHIREVKAPYQFVDEQIKGPYRYWHHLHRFEKTAGGVLMSDTVTYQVPFAGIFPWINTLIVDKELQKIFDYRRQTLNNMFK